MNSNPSATYQAAKDAAASLGHKTIIKRCLQVLDWSRLATDAPLSFRGPLTLLCVLYRAPSLHVHFYNRRVHTLVLQHYWNQLKLGPDDDAMEWGPSSLLDYTLG